MSIPFVRQGYYPSDDDYYIILGVDFNASQDTITASYRNLAKKYHPDKNNQDERSRREAQVIFEKIKTAYDVLGDPRKRNIYDTLGPEGLKLDGWALVSKQMTAQEIREEYLRLQRQQTDNKLAIIAKPRASLTLSLDASDFFARKNKEDEEDDDNEIDSLSDLIPNIEVSNMAASMAVDNYVSKDQSVTLSGGLNVKNGTGDGVFTVNYRCKYSPLTNYDLLYQIGNGPVLSCGVGHQLSDKTSIACRGFLIFHPLGHLLGAKITLAHRIRNNLTGKVTYKEGINQSVTTSLIYINEKLMFEVTTSYKLDKFHQSLSVEMGYNLKENRSKLTVSIGASSKDGLAVEYGCETRVLEINLIGAALSLSLAAGVTLKLKYNRANQEFNIPIYLSDEVYAAPVFYGTMIPLVAYLVLDQFYLKHYKKISQL